MKRNMIDAEELIQAFINKQNEEHPIYEDTSGSMSYWEIIKFIEHFAEEH